MTDPHLLAALHQVVQVLVIAGADSEANIVERAIERITDLLRQVEQMTNDAKDETTMSAQEWADWNMDMMRKAMGQEGGGA